MLWTGQVFHYTFTVYDQDSAPSGAALAITKPDGTLVTPAPALTGPVLSGRDYTWSYDYALPAAGRYEFAPSTTSPGTALLPYAVNVRAFAPLAGLDEVKAHLNMTGATYDDELMAFMMAATELVEDKAGHTVRREFTDRIRRDGNYLRLPRVPVLQVTSVTSIWAGGPAYATADLIVDGAAGRVYPADGTWFTGGPWDVTYKAGRTAALEKHLHAFKDLVRHLWETQRGPAPSGVLGGGTEEYVTSFGLAFTYPRRVLESLGPLPFHAA